MNEEKQKLSAEEDKNCNLRKDLEKVLKERNEAVTEKVELTQRVAQLENQLKEKTISMDYMDNIRKEHDNCRRLMIAELNRVKNLQYELGADTEDEDEARGASRAPHTTDEDPSPIFD